MPKRDRQPPWTNFLLAAIAASMAAVAVLQNRPAHASGAWTEEDYNRCGAGMPIAGRPWVPNDRCCEYGLELYCAPVPPAPVDTGPPRIES